MYWLILNSISQTEQFLAAHSSHLPFIWHDCLFMMIRWVLTFHRTQPTLHRAIRILLRGIDLAVPRRENCVLHCNNIYIDMVYTHCGFCTPSSAVKLHIRQPLQLWVHVFFPHLVHISKWFIMCYIMRY